MPAYKGAGLAFALGLIAYFIAWAIDPAKIEP